MPRIRAIKPIFARHEGLQEIEVSHSSLRPMLTFACLWMMCDREGRFEWNVKQLKLDILPFVPYDLGAALDLLAEHGYIVRYEVAGKNYGHIPSWHDHQHINKKESASTLPAPKRHRIRTVNAPDEDGGEVERERKKEGKGKEWTGDDLAHHVLREAGIPSQNPGLTTAVSEALDLKADEPGWTHQRAAEHMISQAKAYKASPIWNTQFKKSWVKFFSENCYDQQPGAWAANGQGPPGTQIVASEDATELLEERRRRRAAVAESNGKN